MLTNKQVCDRLSAIYPDFGQCGENIDVDWDQENQAWAIDFGYDGYRIRHYLENEDAAVCIIDNRCVGMAIEFGQFR